MEINKIDLEFYGYHEVDPISNNTEIATIYLHVEDWPYDDEETGKICLTDYIHDKLLFLNVTKQYEKFWIYKSKKHNIKIDIAIEYKNDICTITAFKNGIEYKKWVKKEISKDIPKKEEDKIIDIDHLYD